MRKILKSETPQVRLRGQEMRGSLLHLPHPYPGFTMTIATPIAADDLAAIAQETWSTVINLALDPGDAEPAGEVLVSCVQIMAAQGNYVVAITTSGNLAAQLAAGMLQMDAGDIGEQDRNDAFGEIANILGGGVKGKIPGASSMSMPVVVSGVGVTVSYPKCVLCLSSNFQCAGSALAISVYHQE